MNKKELEAFAREAAKGLKREKDLNEFSQMLTKVAVEAALNAELDDHLGYSKHETSETDNKTRRRKVYNNATNLKNNELKTQQQQRCLPNNER